MKLTYEELKDLLTVIELDIKLHPWIRTGQSLFNNLVKYYPDFNYIRGTSADPFYVDAKLLTCIAEIASQEAIRQWLDEDLKIKFKSPN